MGVLSLFGNQWQGLKFKISYLQIAIWLGYGLLTAFFSSAYAFLIGPMMKQIWTKTPTDREISVLMLAGILMLTILLKNLFSYLYKYTEKNWIGQILAQIQSQIFDALLKKDIDTLADLERDHFEHLLGQKQDEIALGLKQFSSLVRDGLQVICLLLVAFWIYPQFFIALIIIYPIFFLPMRKLSTMLKKAIKAEYERNRQANLHAKRWFKDLVLLRTHAHAHAYESPDQTNKQSDQNNKASSTLIYLETLSPLLNEMSVGLVLIAILQYQQHQANHTLALDQVTSFLICILMLYQPLKQIALNLPQLLKLNLDLQILSKILEPPAQKPWDERFFKVVDQLEDGILLRVNDLSVLRKGKSVLSNLKIDFYPNRFYLIQGENGSGKSSFFLSLLGLLSIQSGQIILSREAIGSKASLINWDEVFSISFQEAKVREMDTPNLQSEVHGSGGEKKQQDLMRAFRKKHLILLLDEPETFLDIDRKQMIFEYLASQKGKQSILMISHDPMWLKLADHVLHFKSTSISKEDLVITDED
jgi:ABC-type bacteriocin/lantibiotic exporter with double-glycine peptidase domain